MPFGIASDPKGAKLCPDCLQIVIPGPGGAGFINNNRRCCDNSPSLWKSQPDRSQVCPNCKGIALPCPAPLSVHDRALVHVKRVFDLEDGGDGSSNIVIYTKE